MVWYLAFGVVALAAVAAQGGLITVAKSGGQYTTIAAGVSAAQAGDTVRVSAGTYNERITTARSGNGSARIVVRTIDSVNIYGVTINHNYITVEGFTIVAPTGTAGISLSTSSSSCVVRDNSIGSENTWGFLLNLFGTNHLVENNYFYNTSGDAIRAFGSGHVIRYNEFYQISSNPLNANHTDIIQTWGVNNQQPVYNTVFENNYIHDCDCQIGNFEEDGQPHDGYMVFRNNIYVRAGVQINVMMSRLKFLNNVYYECNKGNSDHTIFLNSGSDFEIKNNLFIGCGAMTGQNGWYKVGSGISGLDADYNYVAGTQLSGYIGPGTAFTEAHGIKGGDPKFRDAAAHDLRLLASSPAINAGTTLTGFIVDFYGISRPQGAAWDMGAYELVTPNAPTGLTSPTQTAHTITLNWTAPAPAAGGTMAAAYIIKRDNVQVGTSATTAFTDSNLAEATTCDYQVYAVSALEAISATAATGSFSTIGDAVGPVVTRVRSLSLTKVQVFFDEPVEQATSEALSSYQFTGGVTVSAAALQADQRSVIVTTSQQTESTVYTITVGSVRDASTAHNTMTQSPHQFTALFKFEDDFEAGNITKWTPATSSVWTVTDDAGDKSLFIGSAIPAERLLVNRTYNLLSFDADLKGFGASAYRNLSLIIGLQDTSNYYHINFAGAASAAYNGIFKVVNKVETRLATAAALLTETTQYHHVRVTWNGATGEIKAYFDQSYTPAFSVVDTTYRSGKCGLWSKGSKQGYFDNVEVVSYVRTDNFGTPVGIDPAGPRAVTAAAMLPNPLALAAAQKLSMTGAIRFLSLAGRPVWPEQTGLYLAIDRTSGQARRVLVTR
jgi:hypothetical protein